MINKEIRKDIVNWNFKLPKGIYLRYNHSKNNLNFSYRDLNNNGLYAQSTPDHLNFYLKFKYILKVIFVGYKKALKATNIYK